MIEAISPSELRDKLQDEQLLLLDVREADEYVRCHIEGSVHIPLSEISHQLNDLVGTKQIAIICHHGIRSMQVAQLLADTGRYDKIFNLSGGIDAWASEIDPEMPRY